MPESKIEILLVEDSADDADLTTRALRKNNMTNKIMHVKDGVEAIDVLFNEGNYGGHHTPIKPKVILMDLHMPRMNGIEVLEKIKNDDRTKSIPVVILSSSKQQKDIRRCYELGANSYIIKPVEFEAFAQAINSIGIYWLLTNNGA